MFAWKNSKRSAHELEISQVRTEQPMQQYERQFRQLRKRFPGSWIIDDLWLLSFLFKNKRKKKEQKTIYIISPLIVR